MKTLFPAMLCLATSLFMTATTRSEQLLYLASTQEKNIVAHAVDEKTGELTERFAVDLPGNAGPMAFSPDRSFVYAAVTGLADGKAGVCTLKRNLTDGTLKLVATATITSRAPYIRADKTGRYLLAAHYGAGDVTMYRIKDGVCTNELLSHHTTEKTAHCIEMDPSGKFAFVPHTSPNKVYQFKLDTSAGKLTPNDPPFVSGPDEDHDYHQPRHFAFHPSLQMAYTSNERGGGISAWKFDPATGTLKLTQTLSTLPPDFEGKSAAADIRITSDGRFAYVSNRDLTSSKDPKDWQDTLAAVSLNLKTGAMKIVGHFPTSHFPRSICIDDGDQFLYAAGQKSSTLFAYRIDAKSGKLKLIAIYETGGVPIWAMCATLGK